MTFASIVLVCASLLGFAQTNIINTIAGKDSSGYSGDGGLATNAKLYAPYAIAIDVTDNIYVVDGYNHAIRKIASATNIITTIAGNGIAGFSGDDSLAKDAKLFAPEGICIDKNGDIYISDGLNYRLRKINVSTGIISTIAGNGLDGYVGDNGLATEAQIGMPVGICVDNSLNIYFADALNHVVRKIDGNTGIITTIAGKGYSFYSGDGGPANQATLNNPSGLELDRNGDLIIMDTHNFAVRKVIMSSGIISTLAGNGTPGFSGDGGLATDAILSSVTNLCIDAQNNLYISDQGNGAIRKIDVSTGIISRVAGTGTPGFSGDGGPALDAQIFSSDVKLDSHGNMIIDDYQNNRIRRVSSSVAVASVNAIPLTIFPNPTTGTLHVSVPAPTTKSDLFVTNSIGQEVYREALNGSADIDLSNLPNGVYVVHLAIGSGQHTEKVVVMH